MSRQSNQKINAELFSLEPTALLEFFVIYYDYVNQPDEKLYIHGGTNGIQGSIYWQGQEYSPFPIQSSGFESKGDGSLPRPKLMVSNQDFFMSNLLRRHSNLIGAKVVRKRTFLKFLDNQNFSENKNPYGSADSTAGLEDQVFFILRKSAETRSIVEFELASPLELENVNFPKRIVMSRYCSFHYRGLGCRYSGPPVADENDVLISSPVDLRSGLIRRKYTNDGSAPSSADNFTTKLAASTFVSETVTANATVDNEASKSYEFLGYFKVDRGEAGRYFLGVDPDDAADILLNGRVVASSYTGGNQNGSAPKGTQVIQEWLQEGNHRILIRFCAAATSPQGLGLYYKTPGSDTWVAIPASRFYYDIDETGKMTTTQRFSTAVSLFKNTALDGYSLFDFGSGDRTKWKMKTQYRVGDFVYLENFNIKVPKQDINAIPNWEPLYKVYVCIKDHTSSSNNHPFFNKVYWLADQCSKTLTGCSFRFGGQSSLPFGGFPGTEEYSINQ